MDKFIIRLDNEYLEKLVDVEDTKGKGAYCNGAFNSFNAVIKMEAITTNDMQKAETIEGYINLKGKIETIVRNKCFEKQFIVKKVD